MRLRFTKMQGIGNDFVMLDGVSQKLSISPAKIKKLADRHFGVGCDQVLIVEAPQNPQADFRYRIFNANGEEVENCGNGARCFAIFVQQRGLTAKNEIVVETKAGEMILRVCDNKNVTVNMGVPALEPKDIPFDADERATTYPLKIEDHTFSISAVSLGNPHAVIMVDDVREFPVEKIGPTVESHRRFPNKVNAGFLQIVSPEEAYLRVYERGVGETLACGTGACAAMVAGGLQGLLSTKTTMHLTGGDLSIEWQGEGQPVMMTGPATTVFHGQIKL